MHAVELLLRPDVKAYATRSKPNSAEVLVRLRGGSRDENPSLVMTLADDEILVGTDHPNLTDNFVKLRYDSWVADTLRPSQQDTIAISTFERHQRHVPPLFARPIYRAQVNSESTNLSSA